MGPAAAQQSIQDQPWRNQGEVQDLGTWMTALQVLQSPSHVVLYRSSLAWLQSGQGASQKWIRKKNFAKKGQSLAKPPRPSAASSSACGPGWVSKPMNKQKQQTVLHTPRCVLEVASPAHLPLSKNSCSSWHDMHDAWHAWCMIRDMRDAWFMTCVMNENAWCMSDHACMHDKSIVHMQDIFEVQAYCQNGGSPFPKCLGPCQLKIPEMATCVKKQGSTKIETFPEATRWKNLEKTLPTRKPPHLPSVRKPHDKHV